MSRKVFVRSENNFLSSLRFWIENQQSSIIVSSKFDLVSGCFTGLSTLYFQSENNTSQSTYFSPEIALGFLISDDNDESICGSLLPLHILKELCYESFSTLIIENFLKVCSCLYNFDLTFEDDLSDENSEATSKSSASIELPAGTLWKILLLAEIFGTKKVSSDCKRKLSVLLLNKMERSAELPAIVDAKIDPQIQSEVENKLIGYFLRHGTPAQNRDVITEKNYTSPISTSQNIPKSTNINLSQQQHKQKQQKPQTNDVSPVTDRSSLSDSDITSNYSMNHLENPTNRLGFHLNTPFTSFRTTEDDYSIDSWQPFNEKIQRVEIFPPEIPQSILLKHGETATVQEKRKVEFTSVKPLKKSENKAQCKTKNPEVAPAPKSTLTTKDLEFSRELALLRIKEAKIKKELEDSKLLSEKWMKENRLKALELKTQALRLQSEKKPDLKPAINVSKADANYNSYSNPSTNSGKRTESNENNFQRSASETLVDASKFYEYLSETKEAQRKARERIKLRKEKENSKVAAELQMKKTILPPDQSRILKEQSVTKTKYHISIKNPLTPGQASPPEFHTPTVYSQEALRAVGLGYSPNIVGPNPIEEHSPEEPETIIPFENQTTPISPKSNQNSKVKVPAPTFQLEVNIIRAWELSDCLGGTNSYVLMKLTSSAQALMTPTILNSTSPYYGSSFAVKLPLDNELSNSEEKPEEILGTFLIENSLRFVVLNKNMSLSDEMIGAVEMNVFNLLQEQKEQQSVSIQLLDQQGDPTGYLEIQVKLTQNRR